jgi:hypothetical protein
MKIALKYGLLITLGIILWVVIAHALVPNPDSKIHSLGAMLFFNLAEISGIYFGIKAKRSAGGGEIEFKKGVKTGVSIAFVYAISSCLFFLIEILILGPKILAGEPRTQTKPMWQIALGAFAGLFIFAILLGVIYSTLTSFLLALREKRRGVR